MPRYLFTIEYLGKNYQGSQMQPHGNTIQDKLEAALRTLTQKKISTIFSGRTDTGVSAYGQTFHADFDDGEINPRRFIYALNHFLPEDIRVTKMEQVGPDFHAQKSAKYRHYRYTIRNTDAASVFDNTAFHYPHSLDIGRINKMLSHLVGEYDFSAFKNSSQTPYSDCQIYAAQAERAGEYIHINIVGSRFLYNMVRTIVGTVLELEKTGASPENTAEILKSKDRTKAGPTASAEGLTLIKVGYDNQHRKGTTNENL
jgi:tRNA pseudouridine38-40 synthase